MMSFREYVTYELSSQGKFNSILSQSLFPETITYSNNTINLIIEKIINTLHFQCYKNNKAVEIFKIAHDCATINFSITKNLDYNTILLKGSGVISELFGMSLLIVVEEIAQQTKSKNNTINYLMAAIAPIVLTTLNKINLQYSFSPKEMCNYLLNESTIKLNTHTNTNHYEQNNIFKKWFHFLYRKPIL
ncbi:MAG TPA: hypothetical protein PK191_02925 [Niabella sp.]|mgnify:CR=1 FL=1|nr:hypothetical protein [Niabella sp.]HOZ96106.1 hypothetical protein [Niabella sp.]HQW13472.1 hypothetical protein [Niabella sp.]HQX18866.1 hypothetical protein [Niabella sp.]HQX41556.1 hypothetical protein [Niabella sp.]